MKRSFLEGLIICESFILTSILFGHISVCPIQVVAASLVSGRTERVEGADGAPVRTLLELVGRLGAIAGALLATYSSPAHSAEALLRLSAAVSASVVRHRHRAAAEHRSSAVCHRLGACTRILAVGWHRVGGVVEAGRLWQAVPLLNGHASSNGCARITVLWSPSRLHLCLSRPIWQKREPTLAPIADAYK